MQADIGGELTDAKSVIGSLQSLEYAQAAGPRAGSAASDLAAVSRCHFAAASNQSSSVLLRPL